MIKGFHKEGKKILICASIAALIIIPLSLQYLHPILGYLLTLTVLVFLYLFFQFFRVPNRKKVVQTNSIISPADGKVVVIEEVMENEFLKTKCRQISIFMSPLNVHINWHPIDGEVVYSAYHPGKFLVAWHPKSSTENERTTVAVKHTNGTTILFRQVAGAVARRIKCYANENDQAKQGEEFGFIKFGSRIDVFLPLDAKINVKLEQKVVGSQTVIAEF